MRRIGLFALAAALTVLAGCTASEPPARTPRAETPISALPTLSPPTGPPSRPTDDIEWSEVVVGTINRGGEGPCYGLVTDDGIQYALHEAKGRTLTRGMRVRVAATASRLDIACGTGTLIEVKTLTPLR